MSVSFSRDQLVLVAESIFVGAALRIESTVPSNIPISEFDARKSELWGNLFGPLGTVRNQLIALARSLGHEITDTDQCTQFQRMTEIYVNEIRSGAKKSFPSVKWLAESFVDQYLQG